MEDKNFKDVVSILPCKIKDQLNKIDPKVQTKISEIRLRVNRPITLTVSGGGRFLQDGQLMTQIGKNYILTIEDIEESYIAMCGYSVHTHQNEIACGYVTMQGGHRCGIGGTVVEEEGKIVGIRDISSINIRIARQIKGVGEPVLKQVKQNRGFIIAGAPASGKTTILRDIARILGEHHRVTVVDERGEIAACCYNTPQNDVGKMTDVLNGYPKAKGIIQAIRTLSPEYIVCDELGTSEEVEAVIDGVNSGSQIITSIHAEDIIQLKSKPQLRKLIETKAFYKVFFLGKGEYIGEIISVEEIY